MCSVGNKKKVHILYITLSKKKKFIEFDTIPHFSISRSHLNKFAEIPHHIKSTETNITKTVVSCKFISIHPQIQCDRVVKTERIK